MPLSPRLSPVRRVRASALLSLLVILFSWGALQPADAWPYVDCSGSSPIFALERVTAYYSRANNSIGLLLNGNFTDAYWAQGYSAAATSQWRTSIQTTIMGTQLYRSEGPACMADGGVITGGCPTAPGLGTIQTNFNISQSAPFAELIVTMQIVGSNNQSIVCVAVLLEQTMPQVSTVISYLPLALAFLSGGISLAATMMRASVGNGFLGAVASYGLPTEAISVHTPGFFDIIFYTQFMLMTGQLSIDYPSYYSTFTALFHWSFLEFANTLVGKGPANATNVLMYGGAGSVNQIKTIFGNSSWSNSSGIDLQRRYFLQEETFKQLPGLGSIPTIGTAGATAVLRYAGMTLSPPTPTLHWQKRQSAPSSAEASSPTISPSPTTPQTPSSTSSSSSPSSPSSSSFPSSADPPSSASISHSKTATGGKSTTPAIRSTPSNTPTSSTTATSVIPTITDPFTNTSGGSVQFNASRFGVEAYAAAIGAFPSALFLGTLINAGLAAGASLVLSAAFLGVAWIMAKENHQRGKTLHHAINFVAGNLLRIWTLLFTPLALSAMYQLTISSNVGLTVAAAVSLLLISVGSTIFFTWRVLRASSELLLYDDQATLLKYGTLYNTLAQEGTLFFLVTLLVRFLWGLVISMLSSFGVAQVAVLMVVEFGYVLVLGVKWPYAESSDNKFHLFLGIIRIVITGCSIAYIQDLQASPDLRELFAYIQMALHLAVFIVIFALVLWNFIQVCMFWRMRHLDAWKGPTKTYSFEGPENEVEQGWGPARRPHPRGPGGHTRGVVVNRLGGDVETDEFDPSKDRSFTVISYSSLGATSPARASGARRESMQHALQGPSPALLLQQYDSSDEDTLRYGSPAERYRQSRLTDSHRSRLGHSASDGGSLADETLADRRLDSLMPIAGLAAGALAAGAVVSSGASSSPLLPPSQGSPSSSAGGSTKADPRHSPSSGTRGNLPQRESYANLQRMTHQGAPDPRTRRMSDITRDGPYLFAARKEEQDNANAKASAKSNEKAGAESGAAIMSSDPKQGLLAGLKESLGNAFRFGKRSSNAPSSDGSKPKAFEVMRRPRLNYAGEPSPSAFVEEAGSQPGGDQPRGLNSLGISRFFQESDRGYERNRNLFVANPSAMISRTGSLVSTVSGAVPLNMNVAASARLNRNGSGAAESIRTLNYAKSRGAGVGSGLGPTAGGGGGPSLVGDKSSMVASVVGGVDLSISEHGGTASMSDKDSRRTSSAVVGGTGSGAGSQLYPPRHSADSANNIAEALATEQTLVLEGGAILRVSKGPEKVVQYWHNKTGQYVESIAESLKDEKARDQGEKTRDSGEGTSAAATASTPPLLLPSLKTQQQKQQRQHQDQHTERQRQPSSLSNKSQSMAESSTGGGGSVWLSSAPESPTDSHESPTTAIVAARMHEIVGRMFPDRSVRLHSDHDLDSDSILSEDTASTFSGRISGGQRSILQQTQLSQPTMVQPGAGLQLDDADEKHHRQDEDAQSIERYNMLEPVHGDSDVELEQDPDATPRQSDFEASSTNSDAGNSRVFAHGEAAALKETPDGPRSDVAKRSSSSANEKRQSSTPLMRTFSGPSKPTSAGASGGSLRPGLLTSKQNSISSRPLAQSPLHSPSVQLGSGSGSGGMHLTPAVSGGMGGQGDLSRQSSVRSATSSKIEYLDTTWLDHSHNSSDVDESDANFLNRNASVGTVRTEASYVTARSQYPSDDEDQEGL